MGAPYVFTQDDQMNPVYCVQCRAHIPIAVSNANRGLCAICSNQTVQAANVPDPAASYPKPYESGYRPLMLFWARKIISSMAFLSALGVLWTLVMVVNAAIINLRDRVPGVAETLFVMFMTCLGWLLATAVLLALAQALAILQDHAERVRGRF